MLKACTCVYVNPYLTTDYFETHKAEECPREGRGNPTLAKFLEAKDMGLFRLLCVVVSRLSKWKTGPCPVCKDQDPEHDVQECVRVARYSKENDQLVVRPRVPELEPTAQEWITGAYGPCHKCSDPLANHLVDDCQEPEGGEHRTATNDHGHDQVGDRNRAPSVRVEHVSDRDGRDMLGLPAGD